MINNPSSLTHLMSRDEVPDEQEDGHDDMCSDRDDGRAGDLEHLDALLDRGVEVDVVGTYTGRHTDLQILCLHKCVRLDCLKIA